MFSKAAILFLRNHADPIIARWRELSEQQLSPSFVQAPWFQSDGPERLYSQIIDAFERRVYRELNRTIEGLTRAADTPSPLDIKALLSRFAAAASELADRETNAAKGMAQELAEMGRTLKQVYSERLGQELIAVVAENEDELREQWLRELPTPRISDHFSLLSEEDRKAFVDQALDIFRATIRGREDEPAPHPHHSDSATTRYGAWVIRQVDYFTPKGFQLVDLSNAIHHFVALLEPLLARATAHDVWTYRVSLLLLDDARNMLATGLADAYLDRFTRNFYGEVGIMLHRIKNKLTSVPSTMATVLAVGDEQYGAMFDPMVLTTAEAELLGRYDLLAQEVIAAQAEVVEHAPLNGSAAADAAAWDQALARLRAANTALQEFLAGEGAEIDTIRTMKLDVASAEMLHEMLNIVLEGGVQTQQLTEDLQLRMNELYERETPRWEPLDIGELVRTACHEAEVDARAKDIDFTCEALDDGTKIFGVRRDIGRPFIQMIDNAMKYTPANGQVTVTLQHDGPEHVLFRVKDSGIGIPPGEEEQVFSLCERCSNAKEFAAGTGTGLYHDRITVTHHNGEMWAESPGVGQGSTFSIRLPVYQEQGETKPAGD